MLRTVAMTFACGFKLREMLHRIDNGCAIGSSDWLSNPNDQKDLQLMRRALWLYQKDYRS